MTPPSIDGQIIRNQFDSKLEMIVDLPIEHQDVPATEGNHGLMSAGRQIQNRQASMRECYTMIMIQPNAVVIWSAG
jgi:hypothetical protein